MLNSLFISDIKIYRYIQYLNIHSQNISIYILFVHRTILFIYTHHCELATFRDSQPWPGATRKWIGL